MRVFVLPFAEPDVSALVVRQLRKLRRRGRAQASQRRVPQHLRRALRWQYQAPAFLDLECA